MSAQNELKLKITQGNKKFLLVCPYDHLVERVSYDTMLPINHLHEDQIYTCIAFKTIRSVRMWLRQNRPLKNELHKLTVGAP